MATPYFFATYQEGLDPKYTGACPIVSSGHTFYAAKHNPFVFFKTSPGTRRPATTPNASPIQGPILSCGETWTRMSFRTTSLSRLTCATTCMARWMQDTRSGQTWRRLAKDGAASDYRMGKTKTMG